MLVNPLAAGIVALLRAAGAIVMLASIALEYPPYRLLFVLLAAAIALLAAL